MKKIILMGIGICGILVFTGCGARQPFVYNATSNVPNTKVYCGTSQYNLRHCYNTPFHKTTYSSLVWSNKYFQAKKNGYLDSKVKRAFTYGNRGTIHFNLLKDPKTKEIELNQQKLYEERKLQSKHKSQIKQFIERQDFESLKKYTDKYPSTVYHINDDQMRLMLTGQKGMKIGDIKALIKKGRSETIIIALIQRVKVPYKEFTLKEIDILSKMNLSDNIIAAMITITTELLKEEEKQKQQQSYIKKQTTAVQQKTKVIYKTNQNTTQPANNNSIGNKVQDELINQGVKMLFDQLF